MIFEINGIGRALLRRCLGSRAMPRPDFRKTLCLGFAVDSATARRMTEACSGGR